MDPTLPCNRTIALIVTVVTLGAGLLGKTLTEADATQLTTALTGVALGVTFVLKLVQRFRSGGDGTGTNPPASMFLLCLPLVALVAGGCTGGASSGFYRVVKTEWPVVRDEYVGYVMQDPTLGPAGEPTDARKQILRTPAIIDKAIELEGAKPQHQVSPATQPVQ